MPIKPLAGLISDIVVPLPAEDVERSAGVALDIGSTTGKIVYRSNKEYKDGKPINPEGDASKGQVHFAMFPRSDIKGMIDYIKENCDLKANEEGNLVINLSGGGAVAFRQDIEDALECKLEIIVESDCFCKALLALEKVLPEVELFIHPSAQVQAEADKLKAALKKMMDAGAAMSETQLSTDQGEKVKEEDRPRILVLAGSGTGLMMINSDGTFSMLDGSYTGGRYMYGLSAILTGENDFAELEKMASESDGKTTDTWRSDLIGDAKPRGEGDNVYEQMGTMEDRGLFPFGKGVTVPAEKMKKGDLVWSVFNTTAHIHAQIVCTHVRYTKAKAVYFCGNTFNTQIMRDLMAKRTSQMSAMLPGGQDFEFHFMKNGGMYGAMGAFLHTKRQTASK